MKIYIMAPPCTGKSYFNKMYEDYNGVRIIDQARIISHYASRREIMVDKPLHSKLLFYLACVYINCKIVLNIPIAKCRKKISPCLSTGKNTFEEAISFLRKQKYPTCLLGGRTVPYNPELITDIKIAAVILPRYLHEANCEKRLIKSPNDKWGNIEAVDVIRNNMINYINKYGCSVFESFSEALDNLTLTSML